MSKKVSESVTEYFGVKSKPEPEPKQVPVPKPEPVKEEIQPLRDDNLDKFNAQAEKLRKLLLKG
jgi:hypothetical protein